jgi:glycosyltransferase involved in cell wall biosynthesis
LRDKLKSVTLVSVVVDTYNHEAFITESDHKRCPTGLSARRGGVLVIDDGSRDGTAKQLSAFADRVRIVLAALGVSDANAYKVVENTTHEVVRP